MAEFEEISKLDVVRRQIETAIYLFMNDGDLLSVNTLTMSALQVINDLVKASGSSSPFLEIIKPEKRREWQKMTKKTYNYSKHANNDSKLTEKFYFNAIDAYIVQVTELYKFLGNKLTPIMQIFELWWGMEHPDLLVDGPEKRQYEEMSKSNPFKNKKELYDIGLEHFKALNERT